MELHCKQSTLLLHAVRKFYVNVQYLLAKILPIYMIEVTVTQTLE